MSKFRNNRKPHFHPRTDKPDPNFKVQQAPAAQADINHIAKTHMSGPGRMGLPIGNPAATRQPRFVDLPSQSYHDMCNVVVDAQNAFRSLPARVKARFGNDTYQLLRFLEDPANREEAIKLKLVESQEADFVAPMPDLSKMTKETVEELRKALNEEQSSKADEEAQPSYKSPKKGGEKA